MNKPALQIISEALEAERRKELKILENDLLAFFADWQRSIDLSGLDHRHMHGADYGFKQAFEKASDKVQELFTQLLDGGN